VYCQVKNSPNINIDLGNRQRHFFKFIKMIKFCFLFSVVFYSVNSFAQKKITYPTIEIGISHRNASIELESSFLARGRNFGFSYNQIAITRTQSLAIDMRQNLYKERIFAQFSTYFRYNHFHYEGDYRTKEIKNFKSDLFLDAVFVSRKKKKKSFGFLLGAGIGYMNIGTGFHYNYNTGIKDNNGDWIIKREKATFSFLAPRLLMGIKKNRLSGYVNLHYTPDDNYRTNPTIWLEFKVCYSFSPFIKKK